MLTSVREAVQAGIPIWQNAVVYVSASGGWRIWKDTTGQWPGYFRQILAYARPAIRLYYPGRRNVFREEECGRNPVHEFHYFDSDNCGESYTARKPLSSRSWNCIHSDRQGMSRISAYVLLQQSAGAGTVLTHL